METLCQKPSNIALFSVLILPMRNGNVVEFCGYDGSRECSYPTYEEWKP